MLKHHFARLAAPVLLIHGGAGRIDPESTLSRQRSAYLQGLAERNWGKLQAGQVALEVVYDTVFALESSGLFNAGLGACLQRDGLARLSAALMNGTPQKFSGVQLVTHLLHPSQLAYALQRREESVLGPFGAQLLARELGIEIQMPVTPQQARRWLEQFGTGDAEAGGTVGAVALDRQGQLAAATSTGGGAGNGPERMSDSATVAGNYASPCSAISCTGIGEQIVDDGLAVRLETRVRDGLSLQAAADRLLHEALQRNRRYGWIALDREGNGCCYATEQLYWAVRGGEMLSAAPVRV